MLKLRHSEAIIFDVYLGPTIMLLNLYLSCYAQAPARSDLVSPGSHAGRFLFPFPAHAHHTCNEVLL